MSEMNITDRPCIVFQGVSKEYQEAISATLETLKQDLNHTLHHITVPASLLDTPKPSSSPDGTPLQDTTQTATLDDDTQHDSLSSLHKDNSSHEPHTSSQDLTAKVEHLINVRTALVDAANGMCMKPVWTGDVDVYMRL